MTENLRGNFRNVRTLDLGIAAFLLVRSECMSKRKRSHTLAKTEEQPIKKEKEVAQPPTFMPEVEHA